MSTQIQALVVGGGISGLTCAYALRKAGIDAHLIEASPRPGGVIQSVRREDFLLELGPQSLTSTASLLQLCRELSIENEILQAPPRSPRFVLIDGKLQPVPLSPPAFFKSSLISGKTKWQLLRDIFGRSTPPDADESIAAFVRRKFSPELLEKLVGPFVSGIYAGDPEKLSARAAFPQLYEAERSAGSIVRGMMRAAKAKPGPRQRPTLHSFREGNETLIRALVSALGPSLRSGVIAQSIQPLNSPDSDPLRGFSLKLVTATNNQPETIFTKNLILATPTNVAASLLSNLHPTIKSSLDQIEYAPIAVVSLGYRREDIGHDLTGFGFLVPRSAGLRVLGTVWNSSLFTGRVPQESVLLSSFVGGATDPKAVTLSAKDLANLVHNEIAPILQIRQPFTFSNVHIHERAIPQYNLGHLQRIEVLKELRRKFPNLWLTGNYLRGPAIGTCIDQATTIAEEVRRS